MPNSPGPGVDALGQPVVDPTANVLQLVEAAIKRQDDLREAEALNVRELMKRDRQHAELMRVAEADRINAIRQVDVGNVQRAAEVAEARATALAAQVATLAEANRAAVAAVVDPMQKDIADLRRYQYEGQGGKIQTTETQAKGANLGLWLGVAVAVAAVFVTTLITLTGR